MRAGESLIPKLPLIEAQADYGLAYFDAVKLPDQSDAQRLGDAAGEWFRQLVRAAFGSWDPEQRIRWIRDIFCMAPKGSSKTTYVAALILAVLLMNERRNAEALFVGPTQSISDRAFDQAVGMIELDAALKRRFRTIEHQKTILDLENGTEAKVKTFDANVLTGGILIFALIDELHLLGRSTHTTKVLRQIRGGLDKTPEGLLLITTTQSDERPVGAFADELKHARKIRDGEFRGREIRPTLPVLYEFPRSIAKEPTEWQDPRNWPMVMPNLGKSVHMRDLVPDWEAEKDKGEYTKRIWASQHLNIEVGIGQRNDRWPGAEYWERRADPTLTRPELLRRSEVVVIGGDGGGLDDLLGQVLLGRDRETKDWLCWSHSWCFRGVLEARKSIAQRLLDFEAAGELTICEIDPMVDALSAAIMKGDEGQEEVKSLRAQIKNRGFPRHVAEFAAIAKEVKDAGLLGKVGLDPEGLGLTIDALNAVEITEENGLLIGVVQGRKLMNAIKTAELRVAHGTFWHNGSSTLSWCVDNLKIETTATSIIATKQNAGDAKIDPAMAMFDAVDVMSTNPGAGAVFDPAGMIG